MSDPKVEIVAARLTAAVALIQRVAAHDPRCVGPTLLKKWCNDWLAELGYDTGVMLLARERHRAEIEYFRAELSKATAALAALGEEP